MSAFPRLFSEINIGRVRLRNRIVMPAMATNFPENGAASPRFIDYHARRAEGGAGLIVTEAAMVTDHSDHKLGKLHLNISQDRFIPALKDLTGAVHHAGARISLQLSHIGRQIHSSFIGTQPVAPSPIPCPVSREMPRELTVDEIKGIVEDFIEAARRARDAGFDVVELHACHGYLISEFFALRSNERRDAYGGSAGNRARFCTEIIRGIKARLGGDFPVVVRINGHDHIDGGATLEDMQEIAPLLVKAGADALSVSAGVYGSSIATVAPMYEKPCCFAALAEGIRKVVDVPVIAVGRITEPAMAEAILKNGQADLVAMGRALIADPALPQKALNGQEEDICLCMGCNQGCIDRINLSMMFGETKGITCLVNPSVGKERENSIGKTAHPKKILVIGGGPGGLKTALTAAERGHDVSIWEKEGTLGGQLSLASHVPGREAFASYIGYLERQLRKAGVPVSLNRTATLPLILEWSPDEVILATGAVPVVPSFIGKGNTKLVTAWDVLRGNIPPGDRIVVLGGGGVGLETAHLLSQRNKKVKILEATGFLARDMGPIISSYLRRFLARAGVEIIRHAEVKSVENDEIRILVDGSREVTLDGLDGIVLALGARPEDSLARALSGHSFGVRLIGDALKPRKALDAIQEGFETALKL